MKKTKHWPMISPLDAMWQWQSFIMESVRFSLSLNEVMSARGLMMFAAMAGETRDLDELNDMVAEKFAVLPEIGAAMMKEGMRFVTSGRTEVSEADVIAWQEAISAPVQKRVYANAKRLRRRK
ncbi:MAG: hypothetical protein K2Q12_03095 [Rickettsiales bacterium]|nr:hypothetical protein [Rickettsiales bacterium]